MPLQPVTRVRHTICRGERTGGRGPDDAFTAANTGRRREPTDDRCVVAGRWACVGPDRSGAGPDRRAHPRDPSS
ncbi:MAG: hypothetical protein ABS81_30360 [Pseudonocardia sp. SCN 72-86]|nr:MAG: hypothetical protein ABS81_30360 [Pseudonocardia sp. SCN 72-86]